MHSNFANVGEDILRLFPPPGVLRALSEGLDDPSLSRRLRESRSFPRPIVPSLIENRDMAPDRERAAYCPDRVAIGKHVPRANCYGKNIECGGIQAMGANVEPNNSDKAAGRAAQSCCAEVFSLSSERRPEVFGVSMRADR